MSRLFKLKHWLSVSDTAKHLTNFLMEPVTCNDVIVFLIEGRFTGSLIANPVFVCPFVEVNDTEANLHHGIKWKLPGGSFLIPSDESISLSTPHPLDLPICRATHDFLITAKNQTNYEEKLIAIPPGTLLKKHDADDYFSILGGRKIPASLGQIVVRTSSLTDFIQSISTEFTNAEKLVAVTKPQEKIESTPVSHWPWGNHHTKLLGHLDATARRYWGSNYKPSDTSTASTNADVSEWLQTERKVSRTMADSIASMLRPDGLPTGPRKQLSDPSKANRDAALRGYP